MKRSRIFHVLLLTAIASMAQSNSHLNLGERMQEPYFPRSDNYRSTQGKWSSNTLGIANKRNLIEETPSPRKDTPRFTLGERPISFNPSPDSKGRFEPSQLRGGSPGYDSASENQFSSSTRSASKTRQRQPINSFDRRSSKVNNRRHPWSNPGPFQDTLYQETDTVSMKKTENGQESDKAMRAKTVMHLKPMIQRWGRSAPGSESIQQHSMKYNDKSSSWQWPNSSNVSSSAKGVVSLHPTRSTVTTTTTAVPEDVYEPYAGQRMDSFDWHLCREMNRLAKSNAAVSPVGVKMVLGMLHETASDGAADELMKALNLLLGREDARATFRNVLHTLQENTHSGYTVRVGNRIYLHKSFKPLQNVSSILNSYYGAPIIPVNFENPLSVKNTINSWVTNFTNGQMKNLITDEHTINNVIAMVLNVIYFKGDWLYPFPHDMTTEGEFQVTANKTVKVEYMFLHQELYYAESEELDVKILRLPYKGKKYSMLLILPFKKGNLNKMLKEINPMKVRALLNNLKVTDIHVRIPKFKFDYSIQLKELLQKVGITRIFTKSDEINLVTKKRKIEISKIIQKVGFKVNEQGTEASSVTATELANHWGGGKHFSATHPFLFFIEEEKTGTIVFIGKVINPIYDKPAIEILDLVEENGKSLRSILERDFSSDVVQQKIQNTPVTSDN